MRERKKILFKTIGLSIKIIIVIAAFWFIYKQIFYKEDLSNILDKCRNINEPINFSILFVVVLLMLINWGLEAVKWKLLIKKIETVSFLKSVKAVFSGVCVSIFTPNRVGEFAGRIFYLEKADRIQAILITILGSISQLIITIVTGTISLLIFIPKYLEPQLNAYLYYVIAFVIFILIVLMLVFFLNASVLTSLANKFTFMNRWKKYMAVFSYYSSAELTKLLFLSLGRYIVFTVQFYLLLTIFDVNIPFAEAVMMISLTFFTMAVIPTMALTELGIRGSVAIYFIGMLSGLSAHNIIGINISLEQAGNNLGILSASFGLWIINLVIPALAGALFVFDLRFFRRLV